ncbi:Pleckstrin homology-like domain, partial [Globisporangium splendens]
MADQQILRTGVLFKKGSGMGPFGRKNWKPRYFVLTPNKLKYFTFEDGDLKGEVDLSGCDDNMIEVMPMDAMKTGSSASTIWRVAINAPERRLLVAAGTEMEMNDWVDKLMLAFRINSGQTPFPTPPRSSFGSNGGPGSGHGPALNQSTSITDFQNFTIARRVHTGQQRQSSMHLEFVPRPSDEAQKQQRLDAAMAEEEAALALRQQVEAEQRRQEDLEREQAYQAEQMRRHEEAKRQREDAELSRRFQEEAMIAAAQQKRQQQEEEEEMQRIALQKQLLAAERAREQEQQRQTHEAMLESQRRQKREQHEREREAREQQMRELERQELEKQQRQQEELQQQRAAADEYSSGDSDSDDNTIGFEGVPPRSSLIGDVKRETMQKQQAAHQRRREAALKEEQKKQRELELERKVAAAQMNAMQSMQSSAPPRDVEIAPRVVEIVRRAPAAAPAPEQQRLSVQESVEF